MIDKQLNKNKMENKKELLLDYLTEIITSQFNSLEKNTNLSQYGVGRYDVYKELYEIIKKYNK